MVAKIYLQAVRGDRFSLDFRFNFAHIWEVEQLKTIKWRRNRADYAQYLPYKQVLVEFDRKNLPAFHKAETEEVNSIKRRKWVSDASKKEKNCEASCEKFSLPPHNPDGMICLFILMYTAITL